MADFEEYEVLYDWEPETAEDLGLFAGEFVQVLEKNEHGWWLGVIERSGTLARGYFPKNYIKERPRVKDAPLPPPRPVSLNVTAHTDSVEKVTQALNETTMSPTKSISRPPAFSLRSLTAFDDLIAKGYAVEILPESAASKGLIGIGGQQVQMEVTAKIWDGANTETHQFSSGVVKFVIGKHEVVPGLEAAAQLIAENQQATVICAPTMAYGAAGFPPIVPSNSLVVFQVKLLSVSDGPLTDVPAEGPPELLTSGVASSRVKPAQTKRRDPSRVVLVENPSS